MRGIWLWLAALVAYGGFLLWYQPWGGPLGAHEIDAYLERLQDSSERPDPARLATLRAFLEGDDGGEFFMVNLIRMQPDPVEMPGSGEPVPAARAMERYTGHIMPALFRRAGHPAFLGRAAGGYVDQWAVAPDPGWSLAGVVRYRSRRDLMEIATDPAFGPSHAFKVAAISNTLAFPTTPELQLGPRLLVALVLALLAALGHLTLLQRRLRSRL